MKIQYISDIHLEFLDNIRFTKFIKPIGNILILAGDIGNPYEQLYEEFLNYISTIFDKIFIITGNHEYYNKKHTIEEVNTKIQSIVNQFTNITFLNNSYEDYLGYRFIGTTLWSNVNSSLINDFKCINGMTIDYYNNLHNISIKFIKEQLELNIPLIVVTHHLPSSRLIEPKYDSLYNQFFASNCDFLIKKPIKCWIYGHTHTRNEYYINDIILCCNPIGYLNENKSISYNKYLDIT